MAKKKGPSKKTRKSTRDGSGTPSKARGARTARPVIAPPGLPPTTTAYIKANNRDHRAIERAIDSSRKKIFSSYQVQLRQASTRRAGLPPTIFAEGDSWFNYPLGRGIVTQLQALINSPIANFAWPGAETRQLLALHERQEIEKRLTDGPSRGRKWDVLLFSGGGDDIVGDQMVLFLDKFDPTKSPAAVLNSRFDGVLNSVIGAYQDLVALRNTLSPTTLIVGHAYDYAWATGQGACWLGPWLRPSLDYVGVPRGDAQHMVVVEMLKRFDARLRSLATAAGNFIVVPTHNTLKTVGEWDNELHPKDPGFGLLAQKFQSTLQQHFGASI